MIVYENLPIGGTHLPTSNDMLKVLDIQDGNTEFKDNCVNYNLYKGKDVNLLKENYHTHRRRMLNAKHKIKMIHYIEMELNYLAFPYQCQEFIQLISY